LAVAGCEAGRRDAGRGQDGGAKCLLLDDSVIRNVKTEYVSVQYFPGIRTEELKKVVENGELGNPDTVLIHIGTNDFGKNGNLVYLMVEVCNLVNTAKTKQKEIKINTEWLI
jgi:lysophospholipase L1-like esterase